MTTIRNTQTALQILGTEPPPAPLRSTQVVLQVLGTEPPPLRNTQVALEVLGAEPVPLLAIRNTQVALQVLAPDFSGLLATQVALEVLLPDFGFTPLAYIMRATDAAGAQYVYWETDDPSETAAITYPVPVGPISDIRIFYEF